MNEDEKRLLDNLLDALEKAFGKSDKLKEYREKLAAGETDMNTARRYSRELGQLAAEVFGDHAGEIVAAADGYPAVMEALRTIYQPVTEYAAKTQQNINKQAGIGIKGKEAEFNRSRASGIAHNVSNAQSVEEAVRASFGPVKTFTESVVNDTIEENARFMQDSGLKTTVTRNSGGKCCDWCAKLDGTWEYGKQPKDFFRQHENCTCSITFRSEKSKRSWNGGKGKKQIEISLEKERREGYNRARSNIDLEKVREISDSKVLSMSDMSEIKEYFENNFGISVVNFDKKKIEDVSRVLAGIDDIARRFPGSAQYISKVQYNPKLKSFGKITGKEIEIGPLGINSYATGVHETTHALDIVRSAKDSQYAEHVVEKARKNCKIRKNSVEFKKIVFELTEDPRDAKDSSEILAYAMETELAGKSSQFTREIKKILLEG